MNPVYEERKETLELIEVAGDILRTAQQELYINMHFLDRALSALNLVPDEAIRGSGTDGNVLYYHPDAVVKVFYQGNVFVNRQYLHSVMHCLFGHIWKQKDRDAQCWNLACDIAAESVMDELYCRAVHLPKSSLRREVYRSLRSEYQVLTAERIYRFLEQRRQNQMQLRAWEREFCRDDHSRWESEKPQNSPAPRQQKWDEIRDRMQTEMETFAKEASDDQRSMEEVLQAENRKRYDYREFLRKFSVLKEEMQVDPDSFDYIFYHYGMERYGNMPLIEPLETKEVQKVEDFVIVLDTSMSCKGDLLQYFLEETYSILSQTESFFRRIQIHILQCDDQVQEDVLITNQKEMQQYLQNFTVKGFGGTDFRPAFVRVQELLAAKCFVKLRGLIYFTDGYGTFPVKKPPYETAFVFLKEDYRDVDVPPWAIKLILEKSELVEEMEKNSRRRTPGEGDRG